MAIVRSRRKLVWPFVIGPILALTGILIGSFVKVGGLCGTYFSGQHLAAALYDTMDRYGNAEATCIRSAQQTGIFVWVLIVLGVVLLITGAIMRSAGVARPLVAPVETVPSQLEKLAGLRDRGVLTEAEFAAEKRKILEIEEPIQAEASER